MLAIGELPERVYATLDVARERVLTRASLQRQRQRQRALSALERLRDVDDALASAQRATVALEEGRALRTLSRAEQMLLDALELPGAAEHYAELQLQIGVSAAHGGQPALADAAFARAASVDPSRHLLTGEASPEVVALASRAFERVANAREGTLHIACNVTVARVFVDDADLGAAPLSLRLRSGVHVLRVEADGHVAYARLFDMLEGDRPALTIVLSPEAAADALQGLERPDAAADIEAARARVFALEPTLGLLVFGERVAEHGWFARCDHSACTLVTYASGLAEPLHIQRAELLSSSTLSQARAWLTLGGAGVVAGTQAAAPLWQRWYVWALAGALVVSAGVWVGAEAKPDPQHSLRVSVDSSALR